MHSNTLISIVIPCYNDAQYIEQSVNSALNQTYLNKEVIVVDDGSNAETKAVLKNLEPKITKLITQENQGQSTARNVGIKEAKGDYILVLDSDDYFEPSFCEKAVDVFFNNFEVKLVTCQANLIFEDGHITVYKPGGGTIDSFLFVSQALGSSMFKKPDWGLVGGYDEKMKSGWEDWEFYIRLLKKGGVAHVLAEPLFNYRKRINSTTTVANSVKYELLEYVIFKHQKLYIQNFDKTLKYLLKITKKNKENELKRINSIDYQIGKFLLKPFRIVKTIFIK